MRVTEVKRHLDGRVQRFECRLLLRRPHVAVVRFDHEKELSAAGFTVPRGGRSFGFFWPRRRYVLYRMTGPAGRLIAHRFDVVEEVRLGADEVSYTDLLLDLWFDARGWAVVVEDEDEVAEASRHGLLSREQRRRIEHTKGLLLRRHAAIVREAARLLAEAEG